MSSRYAVLLVEGAPKTFAGTDFYLAGFSRRVVCGQEEGAIFATSGALTWATEAAAVRNAEKASTATLTFRLLTVLRR